MNEKAINWCCIDGTVPFSIMIFTAFDKNYSVGINWHFYYCVIAPTFNLFLLIPAIFTDITTVNFGFYGCKLLENIWKH
jgi:hypothetical protein